MLCPRCVGRAPEKEEPIPALLVTGGRLTHRGYCVEISEAGLRPWLRLYTPATVIYAGPEPGRHWTEKGATIAFAGPFVLAALVLAIVLNHLGLPPLVPVVAALAAAALVWLAVTIRWRIETPVLDRAIDAGWSMMAPRLHEPAFSGADAAFLAGLAQLSDGHGYPAMRGPSLQRAIMLAEQSADASPRHLAALVRLAIEDGVKAGGDPALLASQHLAPVFQGTLPLAFAEQLLERWRSPFWTPNQRARLRVLLCAAAFEAGLEVHDLIEVCLTAPALGQILDVKHAGSLAKLRLLWNLRSGRPWDRCGEAFTVFELAGHAKLIGRQLEQVPDLLLWQAGPEVDLDEPPASVGICDRGVVYAGTILTQLTGPVQVSAKKRSGRAGFEMTAGSATFWFRQDPQEAARRLEAWCQFCFREFQPQALALLARRPAGRIQVCDSCQRIVNA